MVFVTVGEEKETNDVAFVVDLSKSWTRSKKIYLTAQREPRKPLKLKKILFIVVQNF